MRRHPRSSMSISGSNWNLRCRLHVLVSLALLMLNVSGCQQSEREGMHAVRSAPAATAEEQRHAVHILTPPVPAGVATNQKGPMGEAVALSCQSCHLVRAAEVSTAAATDLNTFHQGMHFSHGNLKCVSCHNAEDGYASLHLADGSKVDFADSMTLCAQCHGKQLTDYQHGAHGGMRGYWDLSRGGRERNHCLHCHDAHVPKYPAFQPVPGPRDRFRPAVPERTHE